MTGWNERYNWTHDEFTRVIDKYLVNENKDSICLDVEHTDAANEQQIIDWAHERGYEAERVPASEKIRVYKK